MRFRVDGAIQQGTEIETQKNIDRIFWCLSRLWLINTKTEIYMKFYYLLLYQNKSKLSFLLSECF